MVRIVMDVKKRVALNRGYSLIELVIALAVAAIVASFAASNMSSVASQAKRRSACANLRAVQGACDWFFAAAGRYPALGRESFAGGVDLGYLLDLGAEDQNGDPFLGAYLRLPPPFRAADLGLDPSNGPTVYWGIDGRGAVFFTQAAPSPDGTWDLEATRVYRCRGNGPVEEGGGTGVQGPAPSVPEEIFDFGTRLTSDPAEDRLQDIDCDLLGNVWASWSNMGVDERGLRRYSGRFGAWSCTGMAYLEPIEVGEPNSMEDPCLRIALDGRGRVWTLWIADSPGNGRALSAVFDQRGNAIRESRFEGIEPARHACPFLIGVREGTVMAFARDRAEGIIGNFDIWTTGCADPRGFLFERVNVTEAVPDAWSPALAFDAARQAIWLCWSARDVKSSNIYTCVLDLDGNFLRAPRCEMDPRSDPRDDLSPRMAVGPDGRAWLTWERWLGSPANPANRSVWLKIIDPDGSTYLPSTQVSAFALQPDVAVGADGRAYLAWTDLSSDDADVALGIYSADASAHVDPRKEVLSPGTDAKPQLAVDRWGRCWLAWETDRHGNWEVYLKAVRSETT